MDVPIPNETLDSFMHGVQLYTAQCCGQGFFKQIIPLDYEKEA